MNPIAICQDCGKQFRVPSADRTYRCKACGGTVSVASAEVEEEEEEVLAEAPPERPSARRSRAGAEDGERTGRSRNRGKSKSSGSKVGLYVGAAVVLLGVSGWFFTRDTQAAMKGEPDLAKVVPLFEAAWNQGKLDTLATVFHPQASTDLRKGIESARTNRGWGEGFANITESKQTSSSELGGAFATGSEEVEKGMSSHLTSEGAILAHWQFNPSNKTWYLVSLELPPPDITARLDAFDPAWNAGDVAKIRAFLTPGKEDDLFAAFHKVANRRGWEEDFLKCQRTDTTPSKERLSQVTFTGTYPDSVKVHYTTDLGEMTFRWNLDRPTDNWYVRTIDPPDPK
ncbi:MAG: hypothetical protein R3F17_06260 [Planctomycetota bacterium]